MLSCCVLVWYATLHRSTNPASGLPALL